MSSFGVKKLSAIGVFVLFVHLFLWVTQVVLTNNIKTNKVVIDTSHLIKDVPHIFSTRKLVCMLGGDQLHNMIVSSSKENLLTRVYEKTRLRPDMGERKTADLLLAASFLFESVFREVWIADKIFEYSQVLYYNPDKPRIGKAIMRQNENGILKRMYDCIDNTGRESCRVSKNSLFESIEAYMNFLASPTSFWTISLLSFSTTFSSVRWSLAVFACTIWSSSPKRWPS